MQNLSVYNEPGIDVIILLRCGARLRYEGHKRYIVAVEFCLNWAGQKASRDECSHALATLAHLLQSLLCQSRCARASQTVELTGRFDDLFEILLRGFQSVQRIGGQTRLNQRIAQQFPEAGLAIRRSK